MPNPLDTLYDQLKGQYPDLVDRSEFIGKLSNEDELKKLHDAASKDIPGFVDFDNFKSKVGESLSTYDQDSDYKAQSAPAEQESAPTDITIPRREKGRHVPSEPQNGGISSEAYVPVQPGQPTDTHVDAEAFDRETGDLDELDRRYQEKVKRLEGYGSEQNLYANEDEARKHYEAYSKLYDEAEQDRLVYNRRVKAAEEERAEQQRQLDLQSKDRKTRRSAEYGSYTNDQVRKEQERLKKERAYLEDPKSKRKADYSKRVMEYNADQTALSGEADKRNKRAESKRAMYDEVKKVAEDPDVQKRITGNDTVAYVLSGNNPYALQNYDTARERAKTMSDEELVEHCKAIAGQKYARGDDKDIYAPPAAAFLAYHNELMYRLGGDEPKSALEMRYDMIDKATESSPEGDNFMVTLRNYLDGTAGMGTANFESDQSERANIPQFAVVDYFNSLLAQKEAENKENVERIAHYPDADDFKGMEMARAALDINYDAMLQQAFDKFGEGNLKAYITAYALRNGISVDEAARRVNQSIWDETIGKEMEESRPKSNAEFFLRRITSDNMFAKLWQIGLRAQNGTLGSTDPFMVNSTVLDEYAKDHPGWDTAAVVTNFAVMEGPIFTAYGKLAGGLVGAGERAIIGAATKTAEKTAIESTVKALNQSFWYRLAKGVPTGGLVGFQYGTMSGAIDQAYYDGNVNFGKVIANGLHTTRDFAIMHGVGEVFGVTGDAILRRGQRAFRNGQGKFLNRLETASLDFLNNVAKTTTNAAVVTGLYAAIDKPALERENKKIAAENARLPEDQRKPLNQIASVEDTFYSSLRMFAGLDAVGTLRRAWSIGVRGQYERNKHVKIHFDKFDKEALEKAFGKNPNSLLRQIVFGNVDGIPAKWFEIDPEAEREIYKELGRELTPAEKEAYATYGLTELRKVILNKDIPWATRAKIVSVITGQIVQEPPVAKGDIKFEMDSSGTQIKRIIVKSLDLEGNVIQITEFSGKEFEAARRLVESLNDRGWRNNAMLCGNLVIDAIEDKTYADTVDEMAREKGIAPEQFEQMVFGIKQKDITGEKVTYQERQLVDEFDKRHQEKQKAETELSGPSKLFEQIAREVFGADWKQAKDIPYKSWGEMTEAEKEFVNRYIDRMGAMGVAERNKLMNANPDWARTAKEYEESVRRRMAEAERPAEAEPLPVLEDEKVSVETPAEERVEPTPEVIELEEEKPAEPEPTADNGDAATELSPEMKIVQEAKSRFPGENRIVLLRFGDHYEVYNEDAERVHEVMGDEFPITERNGEGGINKVVEFKPEQLDKVLPTMIRTGVSSMIREVPVTETAQKPVAEEKPDTEGQLQAGTIGFEPVEQPTERERFDAERKAKAATITDADIEANREALGIPEGTALSDEARQIYAEDLAEDLMRYERFKRGESDEKARFHDYWESKFNPKRPKLERPVEKQEEPVEEEEDEVTEADALIEQLDNLKGRSDLEKYRNALTVFAGDPEIMAILEDLEPHDITEWVSSFLGLDNSRRDWSMLWESKTRGGTVIAKGFKEETGWSWNDVKGFAFMFDNKNGMSPRRVAEKIWENLPSGMKDQYSDVDVFDIMMDLFKSSSRKSDLTNYIRNNRMEQVRDLLNRRRNEELAEIARYKERERRGEEEPVTEPVAPDESSDEFAVREDDVAPFSLLSLNYRQGEVEGGTIRSRARTRKQIGTIAKALGYKIRWVADKPYNAKIDTDEKVLYLNIRTDMPLEAVMGHEITHDLRKSDPKAYEALKRYAKDLLGQEQWDNEVKDVTEDYNKEYKRRGWQPIRADKAEEEVVCDTMGKLLHSRKGLRELAGSLDPGIAGKVYRLMKSITDKVKNALNKEHDYGVMDSALQEFLESVKQRAKKGSIAPGGVSFSLSTEIAKKYPNWMDNQVIDDEESKQGQRTQVKTTLATYKKLADWIDKNKGKDLSVLDASSGLGYGTEEFRARGFNIEDIEPYPSGKRMKENPPTYGGVDAYQRAMDDGKQYDFIISNAVLNVIPDDWRRGVLHDMAALLAPGGKMFINTRKKGGEKNIKNKIELESPQEVLVGTPDNITSYQRFFTPRELKEYVERELGKDFKVEIATPENSGTNGDNSLAAVVVTAPENKGSFSLKRERETETERAVRERGYNVTDEEVGRKFKNYSGSTIGRATRAGKVSDNLPTEYGKEVGGALYVHKDYAPGWMKQMESKAAESLPEDYTYNCVFYDPKRPNQFRFDEAPDFDTAREPRVGRSITVDLNTGEIVKDKDYKQIWHHKWQWVGNDYKGFDVKKSYEWSRLYAQELKANPFGNSLDGWNAQLDKFGLPHDEVVHLDPSGGYSVTDKAEIESLAPRMDGESEAAYAERVGEIEADEKAFVEGDGQFSLKKEDSMRDNSVKYFEEYHVRGNKDRKYGPLRRNSITRQALDKANEMIAEMRDYIAPWYDRVAGGNRYLPEEVYGLSTIFDNASYGATLENTLICTRTLAYNDFCDSVKRKLGRPLTKRESFLASQMLYDIATDPQCLYCYVSLDRKAYDEYLLRYFDERDAVIERYNKMADKSAENIDALYKTFLDGRKDTYQMRSRFNSWLMLADHDSAIGRDKVALSSDRKNALAQESGEEAAVRWRDITKQYNRLRGEEKRQFKESKQYLDALHAYLATEQGQIKDACAYAQGASWAKKEAEYRSYTGELLRTTKRMLGGLASHYGLRFYSFSEYSPAFILENMQMIRDAALRGLKGFAYTKEIDFCKIFLPTGININCSTYGRRNAAGEIVMDERQGANWDEARALRDQYENMGIVFVATDDEMVRWAKEQPWIDVIIPFHIVRTGADIAEFYGWTNYTNVSADYDAQGRHKDIMPPEHNNSIEDYDRLIAERGLTRRFPQFYDGPGDQNYMKLINETRRKASDTPILTPVFNMEEAKKSFDRFVEKGGYWGGFYEVGADDVVRAVDEVAADIEAGKSAGEVEYGRQDIDFDSAMANLEKTRRRINRNREHGNTPKTSFSLKHEDNQKVFDTAKRKFGETKDVREAGYVLPDGTMLDFSGRHEMNPGSDLSYFIGQRYTDHRAINQISFVYDENGDEVDTGVSSDMPDFIKRGAIRIDANNGLINLSTKPTPEQRKVLRQLVAEHGGTVDVDFGDGWDTAHSAYYDNTNATRILGDIDRYFDEGIKPKGTAQFSLKRDDRNAPTFYSNAAKAVENVKQNKATAEQWKAMLTKAGGIKAGEDKWMGLSTWLDEHKGQTLTKEEVAQFVADNGIQMEEVEYVEGGNINFIRRQFPEWDDAFEVSEEFGGPSVSVLNDIKAAELYNKANPNDRVELRTGSRGDTFLLYEDQDKVIDWANRLLQERMPINSTRYRYTTDGLENKREIAFVVPGVQPYQEGDEIHFGADTGGKAIMWVRFGETTDESGEPVLVIDEIQSNRHQDAREKGYQDEDELKSLRQRQHSLIVEKRKIVEDILHHQGYRHWYETSDTGLELDIDIIDKAEAGRLGFQEQESRIKEINKELDDIKDAKDRIKKLVPEAPFERNWHEVAMKRMLRLAAEGGYAKLAWTTGMQQAKRYGLRTIVDYIEREDDAEVPNTKGFVLRERDGGESALYVDDNGIVVDSTLPVQDGFGVGMKLSDIVGSGIADKMMQLDNGKMLEDRDLDLGGGEGMKGFYDDILPRFMDKYGKKWGVKVGEVTLNTPGRETMHSVDINEDMRRSVVEQGQPLFSLKRKTYTDSNGNEVYTETREDGTKDREITTYGDGSKKALWYDDAGVLKERLDYYPDGEVRQVANYDYAGELTRHIQYDENRHITSYYLPAIGTDWKIDENGVISGKSNGVEIKPYNFQFSLKTYHGSAADFDKFDHNFMGSGEGNQAFGWGTYVTTDKGTGRHYAEFISAKRQKDAFVAGDKRILEDNSDRFLVSLRDAYGFSNNPIFKNVGDIRAWVDKKVESLQHNISACEDRLDKIESGEVQDYNGQLYDNNYQSITMYEREIDMLERGLEEHFGGMDDSTPVSIETERPNRYLYKVDIPDDTGENYIDYTEVPTDEFKKKVEDAIYNEWHQRFQDNIRKGRYSAEGFDSLDDFIKFKEKSYREMLHKDLADADRFWKVYDYIAEGTTAEAYKYASNFLSKLGYTGIKVPTGYTTGGNGKGMNYVVFNENDLKITNKEQFSLKRQDAEYQKAAESKYMWRSAARMLKKAAKEAMPDTKIVDENGDPLEVWHGSDTEFFVFDRDKIGTHSDEGYTGKGFYFAPRFEHADHYNRAKDGVTRKFYLNVTNPLIVTGQNANDSLIFGCDTLEEAKKKIWKYRSFFDGGEAGAQKYIDELTQEKLDEINSHDGVWRQGTMDNGYYDEIVVKDSKQVKSADVALYDDNGNFIPLSERFNFENPDVRYSLKRRRNRDDYTDEDRADAAIIANTYLAQADALRHQIEADREREHQLVEERNKLLAFDYPAAEPADRPAIMDRINALRNQINDLRNANYENNTKLRSMDYEYRVAKEILEQGAVTDEEAARFDAGQMTREEKVLEQLFKAAADSRADKKAKQKAIRGLVRELAAITDNFKAAMKARGIESQRKQYDKGTVDHIIRLAKAMMGTGYIDNMTSYEVKRLMGMINNAATRESIETQASRIVDMMLDHQIRTLRSDFNKQLSVTGQKTNSSGVQVQAGLDQEGQVVMEAMRKSMQIIADSAGERYDSNGYLTEWGEFYEKTLNDMGDADPVKAEQARKIFEGVWLASKWYEDVRTMEINGRILRSQMEDFKASNKPAKDADKDTKQRYNDVLADYQEMLRQNKINIIEAYERMTGDVGMTQAESVRRAKEFADAQKQRVNEIQHNANSDLADVDDNTQVETPESRVFGANKNNVLARLLFASAGTYEKFMRFFGRMAPNGEGYLFKRFMTQYHHARQNYWKGRHSAFEEMDKKMAEVFGKKKMHWSDIYEMVRDHKKFPPITVSYWDGYRNGQPYVRVDELNQSEALYLYMINKMPDGRMKLRHMGITDDVVWQMAGQINSKLLYLADWLQSEFLPKMRIKYNETHKRVFGADMAAIEDYFPLRINKLAVASDMDITERDMNDNKPSTITGAIVKRRVNTLPIDLHTDAFDVALSHIDEMEHWSAFAEFNRDNNTLVNYKRFRTKVNNMRSLELGAGNVLWKNFTDAVAIAADAYHPRAGSRSGDHYSTRVAKFVSTAKIALRPYTALKQLLSIPAFWADSDPLEQMKATLNVADTWQWAIENLPGFAERWQSRQAGNIKLANYNDLSGLRRRKTMRKLQRAGMWANAAIDGLACAMGGKAVYETKLKRYKKMGYDEARAQEKALIDAAIAYNNSQQSSEGAYVSPLQVDRTWFANAFSVFRSASMGYTRRMNTSLRQLRNATFKPGYGAQSVEFLKKQMMRDGLTEEQATKWAHRIYRRANLKAAASVAIFGQILPFTWNLGANMFYLLFGNDDKEKEGILADSFRHSFFGPVEGLTGGNVISELGDIAADTAIGNIWGDGIWGDSEAYKMLGYRDFSTMPLSSDLRNLLKYFARDEVKAANEVVNILFQVATGVNPQTITDWTTAILDFSRSDMERRDIAMFAMRLLSTPQQQLDKFYLDEMNLTKEQAGKMSVDDLIKRYATYKRWRETPLTGWMYSDEREKEVEEKFQKRYEEMLEERSVAEDGLRGTINDIKDLPRKRTMMQKLQKELTDSIEAADPELYKKALEGEKADDDEYVRHVTDKDVEQMAELTMKKKALRAARDRKVQADKDAEAGRITQEEYDAIYKECAHQWKLYNYLNNTLPKKLKEWKLKMEPDMQDKYTPEEIMDTIRSKADKALQMRPEDMKMKKGDKKKVKKNKKK